MSREDKRAAKQVVALEYVLPEGEIIHLAIPGSVFTHFDSPEMEAHHDGIIAACSSELHFYKRRLFSTKHLRVPHLLVSEIGDVTIRLDEQEEIEAVLVSFEGNSGPWAVVSSEESRTHFKEHFQDLVVTRFWDSS